MVALRDGSEDVRAVAASAIDAIGQRDVRCASRRRAAETASLAGRLSVAQLLNDVRCRWLNGPMCDVVDLLESSDPEVRRAAVGRVWPRTQPGAAALTKALLDDDRLVRNGAAIRLDSVHAPIAVPNWIILLGDPDPMLRERAAISLGVIVDARAVEPLGDALAIPRRRCGFRRRRRWPQSRSAMKGPTRRCSKPLVKEIGALRRRRRRSAPRPGRGSSGGEHVAAHPFAQAAQGQLTAAFRF